MEAKNKKFLVSLELNLHSFNSKLPEATITFNGQPLVIDSARTFKLEGTFGENHLSISFLNRHPSDTKLDSSGGIIEDLAVEVVSFAIDGHDFTHDIKENSKYVTADGVQKTYGYMHANGTLEYLFVCPGFYHRRNINILSQQ